MAPLSTTRPYDDAERAARAYAAREGARRLSHNHPDVIAGAGTMGLEILEALPDVAQIYVPLGGGGLASGIGLAIKDGILISGSQSGPKRPGPLLDRLRT